MLWACVEEADRSPNSKDRAKVLRMRYNTEGESLDPRDLLAKTSAVVHTVDTKRLVDCGIQNLTHREERDTDESQDGTQRLEGYHVAQRVVPDKYGGELNQLECVGNLRHDLYGISLCADILCHQLESDTDRIGGFRLVRYI